MYLDYETSLYAGARTSGQISIYLKSIILTLSIYHLVNEFCTPQVKRNSSLQPDRARQLEFTVSRLLSMKLTYNPFENLRMDGIVHPQKVQYTQGRYSTPNEVIVHPRKVYYTHKRYSTLKEGIVHPRKAQYTH